MYKKRYKNIDIPEDVKINKIIESTTGSQQPSNSKYLDTLNHTLNHIILDPEVDRSSINKQENDIRENIDNDITGTQSYHRLEDELDPDEDIVVETTFKSREIKEREARKRNRQKKSIKTKKEKTRAGSLEAITEGEDEGDGDEEYRGGVGGGKRNKRSKKRSKKNKISKKKSKKSKTRRKKYKTRRR